MALELTEEERAQLLLHLTPGVGPMRLEALLAAFGSATAILRATTWDLTRVAGIGAKLSEEIIAARTQIDLAQELALLQQHRTSLRFLGREHYPATLAQIPAAPSVLYIRGELLEKDRQAVAIVGSRSCTEYGKRITARLSADLVRAGYTVVSGLARGIDGVAHRAALEAGGRTLAVLAGGLSHIYPPEHRDLANQVEQFGALITESRMAQEPIGQLFPARNRIISGLSLAVVLIEAAEKSGALITAEHAAEQGRTVFAIPGPVDHPASGGTNALIRQGAVLCRGIDDILEDLQGMRPSPSVPVASAPATPPAAPPPREPREPPAWLDDNQRRVWDCLVNGPRHLDEIVRETGVGVAPMSGLLLTLEMRKVVRRLPGNRYEYC